MKPPFDWESLIGVKLFSWIAAIALVVAAVFFLRYSIENGWLGPEIRMALGLLTGIGLLVACELKAVRRYRVTANALDGAAIAVLFSTFFAAHALWKLIPSLPTFGLMSLVTLAAVLLAVRHDALFIALLGLVGGFATPALLSTGENRPASLFSYLLLLTIGLALVAYRKRWPVLTALALLGTTIYQWGWVAKFLDESALSLAVGIFLVFPAATCALLALAGRRARLGEQAERFEQLNALATALPLALPLYLAAVPAYGQHVALLFGALLVTSAGLAAVAIWRGPQELVLGAGGGALVVLWTWLALSYASTAWPGVLLAIAALVVLFLAMPMLAERIGRPLGGLATHGVLAAPLALSAFPVLILRESQCASPGLVFGVLFVLTAACCAWAIARRAGVVYFLAAFFAVASEAAWSAKHLSAERLLAGLVIYAVFALFYLGVPLLARALDRPLRPEGSGGVLLVVSIALLFFLSLGAVAPTALWGLALLLAVLNCGLFLERSGGRLPGLSVVGAVLSWIVLACWWSTTHLVGLVVPALIVVGGFALVLVGGSVWSTRQPAGVTAGDAGRAIYVALVGHVFLLFVASRADLAVPPWAWLAVLAVLDLALGAATLATRDTMLHVAALALSQLVVLVFALAARVDPWPTVALLAAAAVAALGVVWLPLTVRRGGAGAATIARAGALGALALATIVATVVAGLPASPPFALVLAALVVLLATGLWLASAPAWFAAAPLATVLAAVACYCWDQAQVGEHWRERLILVAALWAVFVAYPLAFRRRVGSHLEAHLAAVLFAIPAFFLGRTSWNEAGWQGAIGSLPVLQAIVLLILLVALLRSESPGKRALGRLALVAGAALAFVTLAIPLQLDNEWITIAWALEAAALAWLYIKVPHRGLLWASAGLAVVVFVRLSLNQAVLSYHPHSATPVLNWYLYTYLAAAAALLLAAYFFRHTDDELDRGSATRVALLSGARGHPPLSARQHRDRRLLHNWSDAHLQADRRLALDGPRLHPGLGVVCHRPARGRCCGRQPDDAVGLDPPARGHRAQGVSPRSRPSGGVVPRRLVHRLGDLPGPRGGRAPEVCSREGGKDRGQGTGNREPRAGARGEAMSVYPAEEMGSGVRGPGSAHTARLRWSIAWWKPLIVAVMLLGACSGALAQEAVRRDAFRHERDVLAAGSGPQRLDVDVALLAGLATPTDGRLADLRFFTSGGVEVPYLVIPPPLATAVERPALRLLPIPASRSASGFEADLGTAVLVDRLRLVGVPTPFLKRVRLEASGDRSHWVVLTAEGTLFDLPQEHLTETALVFPADRFRYFRITWDDSRSGRVPLPSAVLAREPGVASAPGQVRVPLVCERRGAEPGKSRYHLGLPAARLPITAIELAPAARTVLRPVSVSEARLADNQLVPVTLGSATIRRSEIDGVLVADLKVPISQSSEADLDLVIEDGDNPSLELTEAIAILTPQPWIYFEASLGDTLVARFGAPHFDPPHYDLEAVRSRVAALASLPAARWGEARAQAAATAPEVAGELLPGGASIDRSGFRHIRAVPPGAPGLAALRIDADVLAVSPDLADVRLVGDDGRQVPYIVESLAEPMVITLPAPVLAAGQGPCAAFLRGQSGHWSCYRISLPWRALPPARLAVGTAVRVFSRRVVLLSPEPPRRDGRLDPVGHLEGMRIEVDTTWSHANPDSAAQPLQAVLPRLPAAELLLAGEDGDNQPLPLTSATLFLTGYRLRFLRGSGELSLCYGRPGLAAPRYDIALLAPRLVGAPAHDISLPASISGGRPTTESVLPRLFWAALIVTVAVLLLIIVRLMRKPETQATSG